MRSELKQLESSWEAIGGSWDLESGQEQAAIGWSNRATWSSFHCLIVRHVLLSCLCSTMCTKEMCWRGFGIVLFALAALLLSVH